VNDITESSEIGSPDYENWKRIDELEAEVERLKLDVSRAQKDVVNLTKRRIEDAGELQALREENDQLKAQRKEATAIARALLEADDE